MTEKKGRYSLKYLAKLAVGILVNEFSELSLAKGLVRVAKAGVEKGLD
jgi:hypothetical protein